MHHKSPFRPQRRQSPPHQQHLARRQHANHLRPRSGRVGERPTEVENRPEPQRPAQRSQDLHSRVIQRRQQEHKPRLAQARGRQLRAQLNRNAQRLKHIRSAAPRSNGSIAVLGYLGSRRRRHQRRARRNVERQRTAAARAHHIHQCAPLLVRQRNRSHPRTHYIHKPGQLRRLFPSRRQNSQQRRRLHLGGLRRALLGQSFWREPAPSSACRNRRC